MNETFETIRQIVEDESIPRCLILNEICSLLYGYSVYIPSVRRTNIENRNKQIIADYSHENMGFVELNKKYGLSVRQLKRIVFSQ